MASRFKIGNRSHVATFQRHDGTLDEYGQPTYDNPDDWDTIVPLWYCELMGAKGGETVRGRQVTALASYVLYGDWPEVSGVVASDRILVDGLTLGILDVTDTTGRQMEMVIDAKVET